MFSFTFAPSWQRIYLCRNFIQNILFFKEKVSVSPRYYCYWLFRCVNKVPFSIFTKEKNGKEINWHRNYIKWKREKVISKRILNFSFTQPLIKYLIAVFISWLSKQNTSAVFTLNAFKCLSWRSSYNSSDSLYNRSCCNGHYLRISTNCLSALIFYTRKGYFEEQSKNYKENKVNIFFHVDIGRHRHEQ